MIWRLVLLLNLLGLLSAFSNDTSPFFIENKGQWEDHILFKSEFPGGVLFVEEDQLVWVLYDVDALHDLVHKYHRESYYQNPVSWEVPAHSFSTRFLGTNTPSNITAGQVQKEYFNYYIGRDPKQWASNVSAYRQITLFNVYDQIDLQLYTENGFYKYDFIVHPGGDPKNIRIGYNGMEDIKLVNEQIYIETSIANVTEWQPIAYQNEQKIRCEYKMEGNQVFFTFPEGYNPNEVVTIDPYIVFSRYSSSFSNNFGYTATYDSEGNAYGAGSVFDTGYPTTLGAYQLVFNGGSVDIGITKYSPDGLSRMYSTYLGGNDTELPHSLVVNSHDELYVLGTTGSPDFPIDTNLTAYDSTFNGGTPVNLSNGLGVRYTNGSDLFIARFNVAGTALLSSTYLGGSANDGLNLSGSLKYNYADEVRGEILIDQSDHVYVSSCTFSDNFPVNNAFQNANAGNMDAVLVKLDEHLTTMIWGTYLGGSDDDASYSITFNDTEDVIVAGGTSSTDFPVLNAIQSTYNGGITDGFITQIDNLGNSILASTYYGTNEYDQIYFVDISTSNDIHIFGQTNGPANALVQNAAYNFPAGGQLLTKFSSDLSTVIWSTRFGDQSGIPDISPTAFLVDVCDQIFLSGWGASGIAGNSNISGTAGLDVSPDALDNTTDDRDFYFMVMREDASGLIYGSFFGGNQSREHVDGGTSRFDKKGVVYQAVCAGCFGNQDFPTVPADSAAAWPNNSTCNLGIVKYAFAPPSVLADFDMPDTDCVPISLTFENETKTAFDDTSQADFIWIVNNDTIESYDLSYPFVNAGTYSITLISIDTSSCNFSDTITQQITLLGNSSSTIDTLTTCMGQSVQIGINPLGGANTYQWTPTDYLNASNISNPMSTPETDITYQLIVSNNNCRDTITQHIQVDSLNISVSARDSVCLFDTVSVQASNIPNVTYQWTPSEQIVSGENTHNPVFLITSSMWIYVQGTNLLGCVDHDSVFIQSIPTLPDLLVEADPDTIILGDSSQLNAISNTAISYQWELSPTLSDIDIPNPIAFPPTTTTYVIRVEDDICPKRDSITVFVKLPECDNNVVFIPNAFSPNNDGENDVFIARYTQEITDFHLAVFDRWGQMVFESNDIHTGWDGTYQGEKLSPSVFAWYASGVCVNLEPFTMKGNVTIIH